MKLENLILFEIDWVIVNWIPGSKFFLQKDLIGTDHFQVTDLEEHQGLFEKQCEYELAKFEDGFKKLKLILDEKKNDKTNCCILTSQHPFDTAFAYEIGKRTGFKVDYQKTKEFYEKIEEIIKNYSTQTLIIVGTSFGLKRSLEKITLGMTIVNLEKDSRIALLMSVLLRNKLSVEHFRPLVIDFKKKLVYPHREAFR